MDTKRSKQKIQRIRHFGSGYHTEDTDTDPFSLHITAQEELRKAWNDTPYTKDAFRLPSMLCLTIHSDPESQTLSPRQRSCVSNIAEIPTKLDHTLTNVHPFSNRISTVQEKPSKAPSYKHQQGKPYFSIHKPWDAPGSCCCWTMRQGWEWEAPCMAGSCCCWTMRPCWEGEAQYQHMTPINQPLSTQIFLAPSIQWNFCLIDN